MQLSNLMPDFLKIPRLEMSVMDFIVKSMIYSDHPEIKGPIEMQQFLFELCPEFEPALDMILKGGYSKEDAKKLLILAHKVCLKMLQPESL